jgi:hypothetical protein
MRRDVIPSQADAGLWAANSHNCQARDALTAKRGGSVELLSLPWEVGIILNADR